MDLNALKYFVVVAELEHVTNAAKRLNITQPALTKSLHRLESELGVDLVAREGRNIRLTKEGAYFYGCLKPALEDIERARACVKGLTAEEERTVRVCIQSASVLAVEAVASFTESHPDVQFKITQDVDDADVDMVIDSSLRPVKTADACFEERIGVALPTSRYAKRVSLADLADAHFICLAGSRRFRGICNELCALYDFTPLVAFESDNPSVVRRMIGLGLGVGFWPEFSWGSLDTEGVSLSTLTEPVFKRFVSIEVTEHGAKKEAVAAFREHVIACFEGVWGHLCRRPRRPRREGSSRGR